MTDRIFTSHVRTGACLNIVPNADYRNEKLGRKKIPSQMYLMISIVKMQLIVAIVKTKKK